MDLQDATSPGGTSATEYEQMWAESRLVNERRAVIEQAKGVLMFAYGIDADDAFSLLRSCSQRHNVKLSLLAEQVVKDLVELARTHEPSRRPGVDRAIVAAVRRFTNAAAPRRNGVEAANPTG